MSTSPQTPRSDPRGRSILLFLVLTFAWSWTWWIPVARVPADGDIGDAGAWGLVCLLVGAYGPSLVGLSLSARQSGRGELGRQLRSVYAFREAGILLPAALGIPWLMMATGLLAAMLSGVDTGPWTVSRWTLLPIAVVVAIPFGPLAEEFGWRGYALPRLIDRWNGLTASIVVGVIWTVWHLPLFFAPAGSTISGGPITVATVGAYTLTLIAMSCLVTWLMAHRGHLLILAIAMHVGFNVDMPLMPLREITEAAERRVEIAFALGAAVLILLLAKPLRRIRRLQGAAGPT